MPAGDPTNIGREFDSSPVTETQFANAENFHRQFTQSNTAHQGVLGAAQPASIGGSSLGWQQYQPQTGTGMPPGTATLARIEMPTVDQMHMQTQNLRMKCLEAALRISADERCALAIAERFMRYVSLGQMGDYGDPL